MEATQQRDCAKQSRRPKGFNETSKSRGGLQEQEQGQSDQGLSHQECGELHWGQWQGVRGRGRADRGVLHGGVHAGQTPAHTIHSSQT